MENRAVSEGALGEPGSATKEFTMWRDHMSKFKWVGRSILAAAVALPMMVSAPQQAEAGSGWSPGAAAAVGIIGGIALGAALSDHHRHYHYYDDPYYPRGRVVYYPRSSYYYDEPSCYRVRERIWVPGYGWEHRRRTVCD